MSKDVAEILRKYSSKLGSTISASDKKEVDYSREYVKFKGEMLPEISKYERLCKSLGSAIKLKFSEKDTQKVKKSLEIAHLDLEPWQPLTFSVMTFIFVFLAGLFISLAVILIKGSFESFPILFFFLVIIFSIFIFYF